MPVRQPRALDYENEVNRHEPPSRPVRQHGGEIEPHSSQGRLDQHDLIERVVSYRFPRGDADRHAGLAEHLRARYLGRSYKPGVIVGLTDSSPANETAVSLVLSCFLAFLSDLSHWPGWSQ